MQPFEKELLKNNSYFVETPLLEEEVENIIALESEQREALMVYSPAPVGKNFAFRNALNKKEGKKIFINFNDLSYMSSFPAYYVVKQIYDKLDEFGIPHNGDFPDTPPSDFHLDVETHYDVLLGVLKTDLYCLNLKEPLYILISNCDLPFDNDFSLTFYRHFIFDKRRLPDNLHVFLITNDNTQVEMNKEFISTVNLEGNKDNPKLFFKELMNKYGRKVDEELLLLANPSLKISDYIYIAGFVINYMGLKEYNYALKALLGKNNTDEILLAIFDDFYHKLSKYGKVIFTEALLDLYMFNFGLSKEQILNSGRYLLGLDNERLKDYEEISRNEREIVLASLEFFTREEEGRLVFVDKIIREFVGTNAMYFTNLICNNYKDRLYDAVDHIYNDEEYILKKDYRYSSEEYMGDCTYKLYKENYLKKFEQEERFSKKNIARFAIFEPLCERLKEYINNYASSLNESTFNKKEIDEQQILMMSYIERAGVIYQSGLDFEAFYKLFGNRNLMYMLLSKSRRLVRRLITRAIDTNYDYHRKVIGGKGDISSSLASIIESTFRYLNDDKDDNNLKEELLVIIGEVFEENNMLYNGKVKDTYYKYLVCPITDFALVTAHDTDVLKDVNYLVEALREKELNFENLAADIVVFTRSYENTENVFHKLIYAYLAFKTYMVLGENRRVNSKISELLEPIISEILIYTEYCYFSEVYGAIYAFFGRIYPKDYLERMILGTHLLKSQGYRKSVELFISAIKYFSSLRIKEGE